MGARPSASASATYDSGMKSALMPCSCSARAVPGPITATRTAPSARASSPRAAIRSKNNPTPFALVNTSHLYAAMSSSARPSVPAIPSGAAALSNGSTAMTGSSTGSAPCSASSRLSADACCRVRVTSTRLPKSGLVSNQRNCSRIAATCPTIVTAGGCSPASRTRSTTFERSPDTVF